MYRNRRFLNAVASLPCSLCGREDGTIVPAHRNEGKGIGIKVSDALVAALCHQCHSEIDNGKTMDRDERRDAWNRAYVRTIQAMIESGTLRL